MREHHLAQLVHVVEVVADLVGESAGAQVLPGGSEQVGRAERGSCNVEDELVRGAVELGDDAILHGPEGCLLRLIWSHFDILL